MDKNLDILGFEDDRPFEAKYGKMTPEEIEQALKEYQEEDKKLKSWADA